MVSVPVINAFGIVSSGFLTSSDGTVTASIPTNIQNVSAKADANRYAEFVVPGFKGGRISVSTKNSPILPIITRGISFNTVVTKLKIPASRTPAMFTPTIDQISAKPITTM